LRDLELYRSAPRAGAILAAVTRTGRPGLGLLWALAVLLFGVGDLFITSWALGLGAVEINPLANYLMGLSGGSIWPQAALKVVVLGGLLPFSYFKMGKYAWTIPAFIAVVAALLLVPDIAVLAALL